MNSFRHFYLWQENTLAYLTYLTSASLFIARLYSAKIFFLSGLTKIRDWDSTLFLFQEEYKVPLLAPEIAAYLGTGGELLLPPLLVIGFFSRASALGLLVVNFTAAISLADISQTALTQHTFWGALLCAIIILGAGKLSVDFQLLSAQRQNSSS